MALANEIERCPKCNGVIAIIGRVHRCVPRPRFGDVVNVPKTKRDPLAAQGAGPAPGRAVRSAVPKASALPVSLGSEVVTKKASTTYDHRDADARRAYQRELMRKRRAKA